MVNNKVLIKLVRKWKRLAAIGKKRISNPSACETPRTCSTSSNVAPKGHFVVYSTDKRRFVVPLSYLKNIVMSALFKKSEEEFGLSTDGHFTLPIDAYTMKYLIVLISKGLAKEQENALLLFVASSSCSSYLTSKLDNQMRCPPIYVL